MKRVFITSAIAIGALLVGAGVFKGLARVQVEKHLGRQGWMLVQDRFFTDLEGKKERLDIVMTAYASDGNWRQKTTTLEKGKSKCTRTTAFVPGRGYFEEDKRNKQLLFLSEVATRSSVDISADRFSSQSGYQRDEYILGYKCAYFISRSNDGSIDHIWYAYNFGGEPLKSIRQRANGTDSWEPRLIKIGEPPDVVMKYRDDWKVDYAEFERRIERMQTQNVAKADQMRAAMNRLKDTP